MDLSMDPCEDFYNYTCRGWSIHNPRPSGTQMWGVNTLVQKDLKKQLLGILEGSDNVPLSIQKARNFFQACTHTELRNEYGLESLHKLFKKVGGFPVITEKWSDANFEWQKAFVYIDTHITSMSIFFTYNVERQSEDDKTQYIQIAPTNEFIIGDTLTDENTNREERMEEENKYRQIFKEYLTNLKGYIVDNNLLERDITSFIAFEKKLAALAKESENNDDEDAVILSISQMQNEYKDVSKMS
ncbi:peptidase-like protein [Leptotrombidium deliense]|uniref:Peptidase-like protein n=1 Tax=Leptotrombidium deliense TaxID=299467 RepID=A0A443S8N3_9ACAR|nr:peptidase-like protein [Leptotrombidium deliense]